MTTLPGIVVTGASGRLGQMLINVINESDRATLVGAIERTGHSWVGRDVGEAMGGAAQGVVVTDDALSGISKAQVVIDFTAPSATLMFADLAAPSGCCACDWYDGYDCRRYCAARTRIAQHSDCTGW